MNDHQKQTPKLNALPRTLVSSIKLKEPNLFLKLTKQSNTADTKKRRNKSNVKTSQENWKKENGKKLAPRMVRNLIIEPEKNRASPLRQERSASSPCTNK